MSTEEQGGIPELYIMRALETHRRVPKRILQFNTFTVNVNEGKIPKHDEHFTYSPKKFRMKTKGKSFKPSTVHGRRC